MDWVSTRRNWRGSMTDGKCAVLVFSRAPAPGKVKSRLVPVVGADSAARLYRDLVKRTMDTAARAATGPVELWCAPTTTDEFLRGFRKSHDASLHRQRGADLGERMLRALQSALERHAFAVLIGCDCPGLAETDLQRAASLLSRATEVVLGPSEDGGYYLVGMRHPVVDIFTGIDWGTERVLEQTRARLRRLARTHAELVLRWDLDRPADLQRFLAAGGTIPVA